MNYQKVIQILLIFYKAVLEHMAQHIHPNFIAHLTEFLELNFIPLQLACRKASLLAWLLSRELLARCQASKKAPMFSSIKEME
jgi:hypothetical protein